MVDPLNVTKCKIHHSKNRSEKYFPANCFTVVTTHRTRGPILLQCWHRQPVRSCFLSTVGPISEQNDSKHALSVVLILGHCGRRCPTLKQHWFNICPQIDDPHIAAFLMFTWLRGWIHTFSLNHQNDWIVKSTCRIYDWCFLSGPNTTFLIYSLL